MNKFLIGALLLSMTAFASAKDDYFYFWADSYKTHLDVDGTAFVLLNLKTSKTNKFDISVNEKVVALDYPVFADEITQFPITVSKKFTDGDNVTVCALMKDDAQFQNVVCAKIDLVK